MRLGGAYVKSTGAWGRLHIWGTVRSLTEYAVVADVEERQSRCTLCRLPKETGIYPEGTGKPTMDFKQWEKTKQNVVKDLNLGKIMLGQQTGYIRLKARGHSRMQSGECLNQSEAAGTEMRRRGRDTGKEQRAWESDGRNTE